MVKSYNLQNLTYDYDKFGNLASRKDNNKNLKETFTYDDMNRLTGITLKRSSGQDLHCGVSYDALGRMTSKQAVTAVNSMSDLFPTTAQTVTYTGFDKADKIKQGNDSICYTYGYDHQRIRMEEDIGSTVRTKDYVGMCEYVTETGTSGTRSFTYLNGPYGVFAVIEKQNGVQTPHYVLKDNLGSWTTITDGDGTVEQRLSFDAWGNLRNPNTWANYTADDSFDKPMFDRGYTGHEHLTAFGLVNMNGRMYDPVMSSFLSADRYVQDPTSSQGFNRYAYCMYNPLRFVDPSGWAPRPGGGHGPDDPPPYVVIEGWASGYKLDEVTITPFYEFEYTPYYNTGGGGDLQWGLGDNNQPQGHTSGGGGYGNTSRSSDNQGLLSNLYPIISYEGVIIGYKQQQWQHPETRAQKAINQKKAYEIQKALKSKGVSKHVKDIKAGKSANLRVASKGIAALEVGFEVYDVINNREIMPSNVLNTTITIVSVWCWPIGGIYLVTDIGVLLFTGQSIGEHIDEWVGEPLIDFKP